MELGHWQSNRRHLFVSPQASCEIPFSPEHRDIRNMFCIPARQHLLRVTRQRPLVSSCRRNTWSASTLRPPSRTYGSRFNTKRIMYAAGGTGLAVAGLLWKKRIGHDSPDDDPRDKKALSAVPLTKLVSGWM